VKVRWRLATTTVVFALLAGTHADAASTFSMDGKRTKQKRYSGTLTEFAQARNGSPDDPVTPTLEDCSATSCDIRELRLMLPKGTTWGRFRATVKLPMQSAATLVLYDTKGKVVTMDDAVTAGGAMNPCCEELSYHLDLSQERLRAGRYTLAIINRAGMGDFKASVDWVAHPPDRRP
jgi:hypothetical protein